MNVFANRLHGVGVLATLLILPFAAGCGGGGDSGGGGSVGPATATAPPVVGLTASLTEDKSQIAVNGTVVYTESLKNTSAAPITVAVLTVGGSSVPNASLKIVDAAGITVFPVLSPSLNANQSPPTPPGSVTLQPGAMLSRAIPVAIFSRADTYRATATFSIVTGASSAISTATAGPLTLTVK